MQLIKKTLNMHRIFILAFSLIIGVLCGGVKYIFTPIITTSDDYMFTRVFTIKDNSTSQSSGLQPLNYVAILNTNYNYEQYIKVIDLQKINMLVLNSAWNRIETIDKMNWLRKRIDIGDFKQNTYELRFTLPGNTSQDIALVQKLGNELSDLYLKEGLMTIKRLKPQSTIEVNMKHTCIPNFQSINRKKVAVKYGIAGTIAGSFIVIILLIGHNIRKENQ